MRLFLIEDEGYQTLVNARDKDEAYRVYKKGGVGIPEAGDRDKVEISLFDPNTMGTFVALIR